MRMEIKWQNVATAGMKMQCKLQHSHIQQSLFRMLLPVLVPPYLILMKQIRAKMNQILVRNNFNTININASYFCDLISPG